MTGSRTVRLSVVALLTALILFSAHLVIASPISPNTTSTVSANRTEGLIAFYSNRSGNKDIWIIKPDGTGLSQLTNDPADDLLPTWSADATQIAFTTTRDGENAVYVMNANGSSQKRLLEDHAGSPVWSPDGKKIQFISTKSGESIAYVANIDGTHEKKLNIKAGSSFGFFNWSPDSKRLIYAAGDSNSTLDLYTINADGTGEKKVFKNGTNRTSPAWSPDGKQIAYAVISKKGVDIFVANSDGSDEQQVTDNGLLNLAPTWSPDSKQLAYTGGGGKAANIFVINIDGTDEKQLTEGDFLEYLPVWSAVTPELKLPLPPLEDASTGANSDCSLEISTDKTYGYTEENPVTVGGGDMEGPTKEREYLDALRGPKGEEITYERLGSQPSSVDENIILDIYAITYPGVKKPIELFIDEYTEKDPKVPVGFTCSS